MDNRIEIINKCKPIVDELSNSYSYSNNIRHILYLIVPAFIIKYGYESERKIIDTFVKVPIIIDDTKDKENSAFYSGIPYKENDSIKVRKCIVLKDYEGVDLIQLIDNLTHEYNHAVNSILNDVKYDDNYVYVRTGLCYLKYDKRSLQFIEKEQSYILEEIINTKQTEELIDIINSFSNLEIEDTELNNALYVIKKSINTAFESRAYRLGSTLCKDLMNNTSFISNLSNLRLKGIVDDIEYWFDNITGEDKSYRRLISILNKSEELDKKYRKAIFKNIILSKVKSLYKEATEIINRFNKNSNFK